jgi:hypothetical protein
MFATLATAPALRSARDTGIDAPTPVAAGGLCDGARVETFRGWTPVEHLVPGDRVQTLDGGMRPLRAVTRHAVAADAAQRGPHLIEIPGGVLDTCSELTVLAESRLLLDLPAAEKRHGTPLVLVPAAALEGWNGIRRIAPRPRMSAVSLVFEEEEIVFAQTGALIHCPAPDAGGFGALAGSAFFETLDYAATRALLGLSAQPRPAAAPARGRPALRVVHAA